MGRKFKLNQRKGYQKAAKHQPVKDEEVTENASCSTKFQSVGIQSEVSYFNEISVAVQTEILCINEASMATQTDMLCFDEAFMATQTDISCLGVAMSSGLELLYPLYAFTLYDCDQVCHVWNLHQFSCPDHHHRNLYLPQSHCVLMYPSHQIIRHYQIRICVRCNQHQYLSNLL